ncbi:hypothetical protein [Vibrio taketomensis]|nr:hypothetical protein [Vibrio taketomensis]
MNNEALRILYEQVDMLSPNEKAQLEKYLKQQPRNNDVKAIITQEELDMLYSVSVTKPKR